MNSGQGLSLDSMELRIISIWLRRGKWRVGRRNNNFKQKLTENSLQQKVVTHYSIQNKIFIIRNSIKLINLMIIERKNSYMKVAGNLFGAGAAMTLANPVQLVRIRMQTMPELVQMGSLSRVYSGVLDCMRRVQLEEGLRAFWKGNAAKLIRFYCSETINFCSKQLIRKQMKPSQFSTQNLSFIKNTLSGVFGSWISLSLLYPIQHARNCISNSIGQQKTTIFGSIRDTVKRGGIRALYLGSSVSVAGVAIFRGTNFGIFDTFKTNKIGFERWLLAYFSSTLAIMLTYPSDTVRRRMICAQKRKQHKYAGFLDCLVKMYRNEGVNSFYRGGPIIFLQSLSSSIVLYSYDKLAAEARKTNQY